MPLRVSLGESLTVRATAPMDPVGVGGEPSGHLRLSRLSYRLRPTRNTRLTVRLTSRRPCTSSEPDIDSLDFPQYMQVVPCGAEGADAASTLNPAHGVALTRMGAAGSGVYRLAAACGEMGEPQEGWPRGGHEHDAAAIAFSSELRVPSSNIGVTLSGAHFWRRRGSRSEELDELHLRRSLLGQITLRPAPRLALAATAAVIDRSGSTKGMDHAAGASAAAVVGQSLVTLSAWAAKHSALGWEWALALAPSPPSGGASGPRWGGLIAQPWGASQPHVEAFLLMHTDAGDRGALTLTPGLVARRRQPVRAQLRAQLRF